MHLQAGRLNLKVILWLVLSVSYFDVNDREGRSVQGGHEAVSAQLWSVVYLEIIRNPRLIGRMKFIQNGHSLANSG